MEQKQTEETKISVGQIDWPKDTGRPGNWSPWPIKTAIA
jgi:hypothetical protein